MPTTEELGDEAIDRFTALPTRVDLDKVKKYARVFAEYTLSRIADDLDRSSQFSAARAIRDKVDQIKAEDECKNDS